MTAHGIAALAITVLMFAAFARGRIATEIVSLITIAVIAVGLYFVPFPGKSAEEGLGIAFSGFGHPALITICALMIIGRGLVVTGSLDPASRVLARIWRLSNSLGLLLTLIIATGLSMFVNDTPVLVLLLPIMIELAGRGGMATSKTLMPINAAVLIGGMSTTIGTSTNLLVVSIAQDLGLQHMHVFHFTPIVLVAAAVALPYLWLILPRLMPDNSPEAGQRERAFTVHLQVPDGSAVVGRAHTDLVDKFPPGLLFASDPPANLGAGDVIAVHGSHAAIEEAVHALRGLVEPLWVDPAQHRDDEDRLIVEAALGADSALLGYEGPIDELGARHGVSVIGVSRQSPTRFREGGFAVGDLLLLGGTQSEVAAMADDLGLLVLQGARDVPRRGKASLALIIMAFTVGSASMGLLPIAIAALGGAIAMLVTGCVRFERVGRALSAHVIVIIAASIAIGRIILESGAAAWLGSQLAIGFQYLPAAGVLAAMMLFVTVLTNFASNATAATVGTPIAVSVAHALNLPAEPLVLAVLFGCNLCYATPMAYQTNLLIMGEGDYTFRDFLRGGLPLVALMVITLSTTLVLTYHL